MKHAPAAFWNYINQSHWTIAIMNWISNENAEGNEIHFNYWHWPWKTNSECTLVGSKSIS